MLSLCHSLHNDKVNNRFVNLLSYVLCDNLPNVCETVSEVFATIHHPVVLFVCASVDDFWKVAIECALERVLAA